MTDFTEPIFPTESENQTEQRNPTGQKKMDRRKFFGLVGAGLAMTLRATLLNPENKDGNGENGFVNKEELLKPRVAVWDGYPEGKEYPIGSDNPNVENDPPSGLEKLVWYDEPTEPVKQKKGGRVFDIVKSVAIGPALNQQDNTYVGDREGDTTGERKLSRRNFLKFLGATAIALMSWHKTNASAENRLEKHEVEFSNNGPDEITALGAIEAAINDFGDVPYEWNGTNRHCSGFVAAYMKHLGYKVSSDSSVFPESSTVAQGPYLEKLNKELGGDLVAYVPIKEMIADNGSTLWGKVPPGTVMYLPEREGHNGYDTYTHTAVFLGLDKERKPMFAEFSSYMKHGPQHGHGFDTFIKMYSGKDITPTNPNNGPLKVLMFDAVEASRRYGLEKGLVKPEEKLFKELGFDISVTVNTNDGSLSIWERTDNGYEQKKIGDKDRFFTVVGRRLKRNKYLSYEYRKTGFPALPFSMYDSISGTHIEQSGCKRNTYTPPMIAEFTGTHRQKNFGQLGESTVTDICLLKQVFRDPLTKKFVIAILNNFYTLHEVPRGTADQEILLREPQLKKANENGIALMNPNLSSGCVNMDGESWKVVKEFLNLCLSQGKKVGMMFSTPNMDQKNLIREGNENAWFYGNDPVGGKARAWAYGLEKGAGHDNGDTIKRPGVFFQGKPFLKNKNDK